MAEEQDKPKIHVDSDWKAQAQAEKRKLSEQAKAKGGAGGEGGAGGGGGGGQPTTAGGGGAGGGGQGRELPPADFQGLLSTLASNALFALGGIPDPRTGQRSADLDIARHYIDLMSVLEQKTKGNLSDEESDTLATTIYELRNRYVQLAGANRSGGSAGGVGAEGGAGVAKPQ